LIVGQALPNERALGWRELKVVQTPQTRGEVGGEKRSPEWIKGKGVSGKRVLFQMGGVVWETPIKKGRLATEGHITAWNSGQKNGCSK